MAVLKLDFEKLLNLVILKGHSQLMHVRIR